GREPPAHALGRGGAERAARALGRHPHRARPVFRAARYLRADLVAQGPGVHDRQLGFERRLRCNVRDRAYRGAARLHRRPHLPAHRAEGAPMAGIEERAAIPREPAAPLARRIAAAAGSMAVRSFSILLLLAFWEALARSGYVTPFQLPSLVPVVERIGS